MGMAVARAAMPMLAIIDVFGKSAILNACLASMKQASKLEAL